MSYLPLLLVLHQVRQFLKLSMTMGCINTTKTEITNYIICNKTINTIIMSDLIKSVINKVDFTINMDNITLVVPQATSLNCLSDDKLKPG